MLGIRGELVSAKQKMLRLVRSTGNSGSNGSSSTIHLPNLPYETILSLERYSLEAESKKAEALAQTHIWNQPK